VNVVGVIVTTRKEVTEEHVFKDRKPRKTKSVVNWGKKMVEEVNGGDNSTNSKNIDPDRRAIHIHGGMEHNVAKYAKYYSCGNIKISGSSEFTRETNHIKKIFLDIGK